VGAGDRSGRRVFTRRGSARETVSLALAELTQKGFVRREGHFYVLAVAPSKLS